MVKRRQIDSGIPATSLPILGLMLLVMGATASAAPPENVDSPNVFNVCDTGRPPADARGTSALRSLLAWRIACQNELTVSLDTDVQSLAEEHSELQSVFLATHAMFDLELDIIGFQAVVASEETDSLTLDTSLEELLEHIDALDVVLNIVGDDAQLANVDLQDSLQGQQQTLQMMSNISKMMHDNAIAIIRKIGG